MLFSSVQFTETIPTFDIGSAVIILKLLFPCRQQQPLLIKCHQLANGALLLLKLDSPHETISPGPGQHMEHGQTRQEADSSYPHPPSSANSKFIYFDPLRKGLGVGAMLGLICGEWVWMTSFGVSVFCKFVPQICMLYLPCPFCM